LQAQDTKKELNWRLGLKKIIQIYNLLPMANSIKTENHTIEELGEQYSGQLRRRMVAGEQKIYPFIAIQNEEVLKYPRLVLSTTYA